MIARLMDRLDILAPAGLAGFSATLLGGAFAFQYLGGMTPCVLCIYQRYPHGIALTLGLIALFVVARKAAAARWLTTLGGFVLLIGAGIAFFHVGVEQLWWEGTAECGATGTPDTLEALKAQLMSQPVVRCTDIPWEMFGVSMAGYNFLLSTVVGLGLIWLTLPRAANLRETSRSA